MVFICVANKGTSCSASMILITPRFYQLIKTRERNWKESITIVGERKWLFSQIAFWLASTSRRCLFSENMLRRKKEAYDHIMQLLLCLFSEAHSWAFWCFILIIFKQKKLFKKLKWMPPLFFYIVALLFWFWSTFKNKPTLSHLEEDGRLWTSKEQEKPKASASEPPPGPCLPPALLDQMCKLRLHKTPHTTTGHQVFNAPHQVRTVAEPR